MERKLLEAIKNIADLNMTEDEALKLLENNNTNLMTEFGLDSLLRVQFIIELEEVFDIEVDMEDMDLEIFSNVGSLKNTIYKYLIVSNDL